MVSLKSESLFCSFMSNTSGTESCKGKYKKNHADQNQHKNESYETFKVVTTPAMVFVLHPYISVPEW